jgi:hypothetical protein
MTPMKKTLMALAMVGIVIAAGYFTYVTYVSGGYEDGAPVPKITIKITEVATGSTDSITLDPMGNINAATTITSTLFAVNRDAKYIIEFLVSYTVTPPAGLPDGTELVGYSKLNGTRPPDGSGTRVYFAHRDSVIPTGSFAVITPTTPLIGYNGIASFTKATNNEFNGFNYGETGSYAVFQDIYGRDLSGSIWTLVCHAQTTYAGTGAYSGTTTVTINMALGAENLVVTATDVDVTLTTP